MIDQLPSFVRQHFIGKPLTDFGGRPNKPCEHSTDLPRCISSKAEDVQRGRISLHCGVPPIVNVSHHCSGHACCCFAHGLDTTRHKRFKYCCWELANYCMLVGSTDSTDAAACFTCIGDAATTLVLDEHLPSEARSEASVAASDDDDWIAILGRQFFTIISGHEILGRFLSASRSGMFCAGVRSRDIFPLPLLDFLPSAVLVGDASLLSTVERAATLDFSNSAIIGLNTMSGTDWRVERKPLLMHDDIYNRVCSKAARMIKRLRGLKTGTCGIDVFNKLVGNDDSNNDRDMHRLRADCCDLISPSGDVGPLPWLPQEGRELVESPDKLFPCPPDGLRSFVNINREDRSEYARLVGRQIRCGKVGLASNIEAGATVFAVGKPSGRQREVWHGSRLSEISVRPPKPVHLASPAALLNLEASVRAPMYVSKRDACCYFDQLKLPVKLRPWFARPSVLIDDLCKYAGFVRSELREHLIDDVDVDALSSISPV